MMKPLFLLQFFWLLISVRLMAADEDAAILDLARQTIEQARYATFATVDKNGQPRTRIVDPFVPDKEFVIYVATKPNTRKVEQIEYNSSVTLFYFDPAGRNYVSVMGRAELVTDEVIKRQMRRASDGDKIYPDFPDDYVLIKVNPLWIEGLLPGYRGDPGNWQPISVQLAGDKS